MVQNIDWIQIAAMLVTFKLMAPIIILLVCLAIYVWATFFLRYMRRRTWKKSPIWRNRL